MGCSSNESDTLLIHKYDGTLGSFREIHADMQSAWHRVYVNAKKA